MPLHINSVPGQSPFYGMVGSTNCSIIIPVFNEQGSLRALQDRIDHVLDKMAGHNEVIYIDDGSTDQSLAVLNDVSRSYPYVRVISFTKREGQSKAIKKGIDAAQGEWIIMMDADLQNPPEEVLKLWPYKDHFDYIVGARVRRQDSWARRIGSWLGFLVRFIILGDCVKDAGCSLKVFRRGIFEEFPFGRSGFWFMTAWVQWHGFRYKVVPVAHEKRIAGSSKYSWKALIFDGLQDLLDFKKYRPRTKS